MRRAALVAALPAVTTLLAVAALAACSSSEGSAPTSAGAATSRLTEITGPIPAPTATVPVVTQPVPAATTATPGSSPGSATTPPPASPPPAEPGTTTAVPTCDAATLFAVLRAATALPPDAGAQPPACAGQWASMVVGAPGQERLLAVFTWEGATAWRLAGFGNEGVCTGAKVPAAVFDALDCPAWEG